MVTQPNIIVVRFAELSTKGKNRKQFITMLRQNIQEVCKGFPSCKVQQAYDRIYVLVNDENASELMNRLQDVFGIATLSLAYQVPLAIDDIIDAAFTLIQKEPVSTFKVITRRMNKQFPLESDEINRAVARKILQETDFVVDVHKPQVKVLIEIRHHEAYVTVNTIEGAKGYPVKIQGKAMLLMSGGIDSCVASYLSNKRGIEVEAIHFASPPYTSDAAKQKVLDLAKVLTRYQPFIRLHIVPFTDIQMQIAINVPESYRITVMRRFMVRLAQRLAKQRRCKALITGESVGQVASQTLESMSVINEVTTMPILRPLVSFDKTEIIEIAKKIGTYDISIRPFEDCCTIFTPVAPVTKPLLHKAQRFESKLDIETLIEESLAATEVVMIRYNDAKEEDSFF